MTKKVLIIEDNLEIQEIYKINFESEGFEVKLAWDWIMWIDEIYWFSPDIIILDIMMPEMDWFNVLKSLKHEPSLKVPVIVCSNLSQKEDEDRAMFYWADLYLRKSDYEWDEIVEKAIELLNKS